MCARSVPLTLGEQEDSSNSEAAPFWSYRPYDLHWEVLLLVLTHIEGS